MSLTKRYMRIYVTLLKWYKKCLSRSMQFIETLKLKSKLFFLFILITIGLFAIGVMGVINMNAMKKNIDSLYFGSLVPVIELNEILQTYHGSLTTTLYRAKSSEINQNKIEINIEDSLKKINRLWKNYESHFKRDEELEYLDYVSSEIESTNDYFNGVLKASQDGKKLQNLSMNSLEIHISHIHNTIEKLINYEVDIAKFERKMFLNKYDSIVKNLGVILMLIIIAILFISYHVFRSIQNDQTKLEVTTKKLKIANKKLENVSYTDTLTTLHNRRYFNLLYDRELNRAKRDKSFITFMMLDIDFFKQYNDTYGHIEGDHALKSVAKVLKDTLKRPSDFVFRLGGEEFGVLLTGTNESDSARLAQEICDAIRAREIIHEKSGVNKFLTISIGLVCCIADDALDDELLISSADDMLYKAKENGRDRYSISSSVSEATTVEKVSA